MDELRLNKYLAGLLCGGLLIMAGVKGAEILYPHADHPIADAYPIEGVESVAAATGGGSSAPAGPGPILALLANADLAAGESLSKKCAACHTFDQGGPNRVGPNLWNIVNAKQRHLDDFAYSGAFEELDGNWSYAELNGFLHKPRDWVKGTKMSYAGLKKPQDRANIIAWLRTLSASPAPLPTADEIAAEEAAAGGDDSAAQ